MSDIGELQTPQYDPPKVLVLFKRLLAFPRGQYTTNFAYLVSNEEIDQDTYTSGLVALASFLGGFVLIWGLILIFLMIKGKNVGCASGRAFETVPVDSRVAKEKQANLSKTDSEEDGTQSVKEEDDGDVRMEETSFPSSLCSSDAASRIESITGSIDEEEGTLDASPRVEGKRAVRTRAIFFLFSCIVLACVPLALAFSFAPMKESVKSFDGGFEETRDVVGQARAALTTIATASRSALEILAQTSTNFSTFCPNVNATDPEDVLGVDLVGFANSISVDYVALENEVAANMTKIEDILLTMDATVEIMESSFNQAESVIWLVPALLLGVSIVTALATFGVILAWKQDAGLRLQRFMSYGVLPSLMILCILCWLLAIGAAVSTAANTDFCLSGEAPGSPDVTVRNMLISHGDYPNSTKHQFFRAYSSGCVGLDPTLLLIQLEEATDAKVDEIWSYVAKIDIVGRSVLSEMCGGVGLDELLSAARSIAKLVDKERRALDSISQTLDCERLSPLYTKNVHYSICTDFAEASAWGTILYLLLAASIMTLITLRASWRLRIDEYKIYHDESEVAENMIVDEHEEYLRYISRYKHEWQEYNGFGTASMRKSTSFSASDGEGHLDHDEHGFHSESCSMSHTTGYSTNLEEQRETNDDLTSIDSGEISFPSLDVPPTPTDESTSHLGSIVPMPPPVLTDMRRRAHQPSDNQEVMLSVEKILVPPGAKKITTPTLLSRETEGEEKVEVESRPPTSPPATQGANDQASSDTDESTDFSSIGKNAGISPSLYWRDQIGLGIEVAMSSASDSLVVSPNTESGLTSFDLTKTPSPTSRRQRVSYENLADKIPAPPISFPKGLYSRNGSDESDISTDLSVPVLLHKSSSRQSKSSVGSSKAKLEDAMPLNRSPSHLSTISAPPAKARVKKGSSLISLGSGSVKSQASQKYAEGNVGSRPKTPTRKTKRLLNYVKRFDPKTSPLDLQTV